MLEAINWLKDQIASVWDFIAGVAGMIADAVGDAASAIYSWIDTAVNLTIDYLLDIVGDIRNWLLGVIQDARGFLEWLINAVRENIENIISDVRGFLEWLINTVRDNLENKIQDARDFLEWLIDVRHDALEPLVHDARDMASDAWTIAVSAMEWINSVRDIIGGIDFEDIIAWWRANKNNIILFFADPFKFITDLFIPVLVSYLCSALAHAIDENISAFPDEPRRE